MKEATIASIATALGQAGIAIIRISGEKSLQITNQLFLAKQKEKKLETSPREMIYGHIMQDLEPVDEVLCVYMKAPNSYTTEDVIEIHCHGGQLSAKRILELVLEKGARMAEAGEFTKRAFLNGRIDLSQAEAVIDVITAKTKQAHQLAQNQLGGNVANFMQDVRQQLTSSLAQITLNLDFPDEVEEELTYRQLSNQIEIVIKHLSDIILNFEKGTLIRRGIKTVIVGKPNVGKSSLLNRLLGNDRAIVTDIPGTTRDTIEEEMVLGGVVLRLLDTAGIRQTDDQIEQMGIDRSLSHLKEADLVLALFDPSQPWDQEDEQIMKAIKEKEAIIIQTKADLQIRKDQPVQQAKAHGHPIISISTVKEKGIEALEEQLLSFIHSKPTIEELPIITEMRQQASIHKAHQSCQDAMRAIFERQPLDLIEIDIHDAWHSLGEITGETTSEDLLDTLFQKFCIGK